MPNNTRNNSKNKSYSTKNENDRFGEIIDYICAQHNINQNELIEKINNYMGFNFLADNTLLSKYKKFLKIPKELLQFLHDEYNINPDYIKGISKFKFDVLKNMLNHFEQITTDWVSFSINQEILQTNNTALQITMDSNFYDFLVANSMSELLRRGEKLITSSGLINDINQLKYKEPVPKEYILIPEDKFQKIKEFLASSNFQNHSSEIKLIPEDIKETTKQN